MNAREVGRALLHPRQRRLPVFQQSQVSECGLACVAMLARYHGHDVDLAGLRRRFVLSINGASLSRVIGIFDELGFEARPLRVELEGLKNLRAPCLLHWNLNHFVVLRRATAKWMEIHDPARGRVRLTMDQASRMFTGVALEVVPRADFTPIEARRRISLRALTGQVHGLLGAAGMVLVLALALEVFTLVLPLAMKLVIDHVLVAADVDLLTLLGIAFLAIVVMQAGITAMRGWVVASLGASINAQWLTNLFSHLLRLPMKYFEARAIGSIMSRFQSLAAIQQTLTGSFIETLLNGVTVVLVLALLLFFSAKLTLLVLGAFALYMGLRWLAFRHQRQLSEEQLVHLARQQSRIIETVRGMQPLKLAGKQAETRARVSNSTIEVANRQIRIQRLTSTFGALNRLIFGSQRVLLIWIGATLVLNGSWTVGVLVVFLTYSEMFSGRAAMLVDRLIDFRLLGLHAERIADIALEEPEEHEVAPWSGPVPEPSIEVERVGFRYSDEQPWILRDCSLTVRAGESLAIVGPSGCGKTTLAKLLLGLLQPSEGCIRLGGVDLRALGLERYRTRFGAVMQDDELFAGTLADNIAFFDAEARFEEIEAAARAACIHADIMAMPMGYESPVGDMGSALSGGQKQRVLLARALHRKPDILLLDEASSHLDLEREREINRRIAAMNITRIVIAHRPDTIASADRVLRFEYGRLVSPNHAAGPLCHVQ